MVGLQGRMREERVRREELGNGFLSTVGAPHSLMEVCTQLWETQNAERQCSNTMTFACCPLPPQVHFPPQIYLPALELGTYFPLENSATHVGWLWAYERAALKGLDHAGTQKVFYKHDLCAG